MHGKRRRVATGVHLDLVTTLGRLRKDRQVDGRNSRFVRQRTSGASLTSRTTSSFSDTSSINVPAGILSVLKYSLTVRDWPARRTFLP